MKFAKEDPITGLLNRRALLDEALVEMGRSRRENKFFSAIMISLNNLRDIIERDCALKGNSLLLETAKILRKHCRTYDKIGRYGISQILLLLPDAKVEQARVSPSDIWSAWKRHPSPSGMKSSILTSP
jgi:diguanylate cyclase (GGDEF)-like protein